MTIIRRLASLPLLLLLSFGAGALAADQPAGPGFVDGKAFLELASANDEDRLIEINVPPALIRAASKAVTAEDVELAKSIGGLRGVRAVVVQVRPEREKEALAAVKRTADDLLHKGWSPLARVREKATQLSVLVLLGADEDTVEGLTVVGFDRSQRNVIFANVVGPMKMSELGKVLSKFDLPGREGWKSQEGHEDDPAPAGGPA